MTLQSKRETIGVGRLVLATLLLTAASISATAQTNTFPSTGNAGVGTTSPPQPLTVTGFAPDTYGNTTQIVGTASSGTAQNQLNITSTINTWGLIFGQNNSGIAASGYHCANCAHIVNVNNAPLIFGTNNVDRMRIDQIGNVGVGTNAPLGPLSVGNSAVTNSDGYIVLGKRDGSTGTRQFRVGFDSSFNFVIGDYGNNNTAGSWLSPFAINWQAPSNSFYINSTGNIGMGMTAPNYKLDVNGEVNATGIRINGTPISAGGGSQWTPSGASIYYSSGRVGIGGAGANVYATDAWVENNMHVQGSETLAQGGRGRLRVGSAWGYSGLYADASSTAGGNDLVLGASSATVRVGPGGALIQNFSVPNGNVSIGTAPSTYKLDVNGNTNVTGNLNVTGTVNAKYQDLAEWVPSAEQLSAGTVVVLDITKSNQVVSSNAAYDTRVAGVISAQPGITLGESGEGKVLVATTGRVRVKVDTSGGAIQIGDLLVTSDVSGVAMKSEAVNLGGRKMHMPGTIIGKALEPLAKGSGEILVLLSLQ